MHGGVVSCWIITETLRGTRDIGIAYDFGAIAHQVISVHCPITHFRAL